jgi:hypothetical protein
MESFFHALINDSLRPTKKRNANCSDTSRNTTTDGALATAPTKGGDIAVALAETKKRAATASQPPVRAGGKDYYRSLVACEAEADTVWDDPQVVGTAMKADVRDATLKGCMARFGLALQSARSAARPNRPLSMVMVAMGVNPRAGCRVTVVVNESLE